MEISFLTRPLRALCISEIVAQEQLGIEIARKLKARLSDIRAASSVSELVSGKPRELEGRYPPQYAVELGDGVFLLFCSNHNANPIKAFEQVDWSKVHRIKIMKIGDLP